MARIDSRSGCKVGWDTYTDEEEAKAAAVEARKLADSKAMRGYDFGYQWPGSIQHVENHPEHGEVWIVCVP